jgi:sugar phosphate isomerase/epimerase
MLLGATISSYFHDSDPGKYVAECKRCGYGVAPAPAVRIHEKEKLKAIASEFDRAGIKIGEVQTWVSALDPRPEVRKDNEQFIAESIAIADELDAACCVTVAGTLDDRSDIASDTPHPDNFNPRTTEAVIDWVKRVLRQAQPRRTKLALETSPWTPLDGPEAYLQILKAVNHPALAVHLDPSNAILTPRLFWSTTDLLNRCFDMLGQWIVSCHAKDLYYGSMVNLRHVNFVEVVPGQGILDYRTFLRRVEQVSPSLPVIMEHLPSAEDYARGAAYIREIAKQIGATV